MKKYKRRKKARWDYFDVFGKDTLLTNDEQMALYKSGNVGKMIIFLKVYHFCDRVQREIIMDNKAIIRVLIPHMRFYNSNEVLFVKQKKYAASDVYLAEHGCYISMIAHYSTFHGICPKAFRIATSVHNLQRVDAKRLSDYQREKLIMIKAAEIAA